MSLVRLWNLHLRGPDQRRTCAWLEAGHALHITRGTLMTLEFYRTDEVCIPLAYLTYPATVMRPARTQQVALYRETGIDLRDSCGVIVMPRAIEYHDGRPRQVLFEFLRGAGSQASSA